MNTKNEFFGEVIYAYTRAQAMEDGELVDISNTAKQLGFKIPVAVTRAVWEQFIVWTEENEKKQTHQDESGRLWDLLWMLYLACKRNKDESSIAYQLHVIPRDGRTQSPILVVLKAIICGGDEGEPVITIMLPHED